MNPEVIKKFNEYTTIDIKTDCWNWIGFLSKKGTPIIRNYEDEKFREYSPRQVSLIIHNLPVHKFTQTSCKNKLCVNPQHLVTGNVARFWDKVIKLSNSDCLIWTAGIDKNGYGKFALRENGKRVLVRANRYSWELKYGRRLDSHILMCHTCDTPRCVNPDHLFIGTNVDNMADRDQKNRQARGERNGCSKLTEIQVREIRSLYPQLSVNQLASKFNVGKTTVDYVIKRKTWKHIL